MAGPTRLELATSGVTGQRSNQLNYDPASGLLRVSGLGSDVAEQRRTAFALLRTSFLWRSEANLPAEARCVGEQGWWAVQDSNL
jgi:hypothetical protein